MAGRPKKTKDEKWFEWDRGYIIRDYPHGMSATVNPRSDGPRGFQLRMTVTIPVQSMSHGKSISDALVHLVEEHRDAIIEENKPKAVRRAEAKRVVQRRAQRAKLAAERELLGTKTKRAALDAATPYTSQRVSREAMTQELIGKRCEPSRYYEPRKH